MNEIVSKVLVFGVRALTTRVFTSGSSSISIPEPEIPALNRGTAASPRAGEGHRVTTQDPKSQPRAVPAPTVATVEMASTADTLEELKRRMGKELYKFELDLSGGGRINNRVCDCLDQKHRLGLEATAEELMSYEHNPVHGQVISWLKQHGPDFKPAEIAKHDPEYYRAMIPEVRAFRKQVMGTESLASLLSAQETAVVMAKMKEAKHG